MMEKKRKRGFASIQEQFLVSCGKNDIGLFLSPFFLHFSWETKGQLGVDVRVNLLVESDLLRGKRGVGGYVTKDFV